MSMVKKFCIECRLTTWHNPTQKDKQSGHRCTYCGFPLGTGPKKDRLAPIHAIQVTKARRL